MYGSRGGVKGGFHTLRAEFNSSNTSCQCAVWRTKIVLIKRTQAFPLAIKESVFGVDKYQSRKKREKLVRILFRINRLVA